MSVPANFVSVQGQGSVSGDNLNTLTQMCTNVATLRSFIGVGNQVVFLLGTTTPNDGGGGLFYYNPTGTAHDDNGVTTVAPTGQAPGTWTRVIASTSGVTSVTNSDSTLTVFPNTGAVIASLNLAHANVWTGQQTFTAPVLSGTITGTYNLSGTPKFNGLTITASSGVLTIANGKTFSVNNSLSFTGTDGTAFVLPTASDTVVGLAAAQALTNKSVNGITLAGTASTTMTFPTVSASIPGLAVANLFTADQTITVAAGDSLTLRSGSASAGNYMQYSMGRTGVDANVRILSQASDLQAANWTGNAAAADIENHSVGNYWIDCATGRTVYVIGGIGTNSVVIGNTSGGTLIACGGAGAVSFPNITTTASAANAFLDNSANNNLLRSTSSIAVKTDIERISVREARRIVRELFPFSYRSKAAADDPRRRFFGLGAEHVAEITDSLVHYTKDGKPDGVMYDRVGVLNLVMAQANERRLRFMEAAICVLSLALVASWIWR